MKAQMNQAFTYISILLLIGLVAFFGGKAIMSVFKANCAQENADFTKRINTYIDEYSDRGSVQVETLKAPCDVTKLTLVNASLLNIPLAPGAINGDEVITSSVSDGSYNIFVESGGFTQPIGVSKKLTVPPALPHAVFNVTPRNGNFKLRFTGLGRSTLVTSAWNS